MKNDLTKYKTSLVDFLSTKFDDFQYAQKCWSLILSGQSAINKKNRQNIKCILKESFDFFKTGRIKKHPTKTELRVWAEWIKNNLEEKRWGEYITNYKTIIQSNYSKYLDTLKDQELKYVIISEAPPIKWESGKLKFNYIFDIKNMGVGPYRDEPFNAFNGKKKQTIIDVFAHSKVGFIDLIPVPIPLSSNLRSDWAVKDEFKVTDENNVPITVFLLKIAIQRFLKECKLRNITFNPNLKICFMMPGNTSMSIFHYYEINHKEGLSFDSVFIPNDVLVKTNNGVKERYFNSLGKINLPLYKLNGCGAGNIPKNELIKNALDLLIN